MTRRYDEPSGKWFDEDMDRCASCYLNHGHDLTKHIGHIADLAISMQMGEPLWFIRGSATLTEQFDALRKQWYKANTTTFVLHDTSR